eukprot:CAMPEP_0113532250 /NCGR_PEP_ID=MMETSP0015_2-20120614/3952_1 /TAXON_ID=2838 /ORGANISM="Odontella" /LENGTH=92 /DNA_ID=CAMNT_0000431185 /DNA_START=1589 /DNA_END=1867 /DNA_ORIENTATION=- /assembly_acc=CAM_ASM_000160
MTNESSEPVAGGVSQRSNFAPQVCRCCFKPQYGCYRGSSESHAQTRHNQLDWLPMKVIDRWLGGAGGEKDGKVPRHGVEGQVAEAAKVFGPP